MQNTSTVRSSRTVGRQFPLTKQNKAGASNSSYRRPRQMQLPGTGTAQPASGSVSRGSFSNGAQALSSSTSEPHLNNQVILTGCIGRDATIRRTQNGNVVANFMIRLEERHKDQRGWRTRTFWHRVRVWNELAESLRPSLQEGMPVRVVGRLANRVWIDQNDQRRFYTEIVARDVRLLDTIPGTDARTSRAGDDYNSKLQ